MKLKNNITISNLTFKGNKAVGNPLDGVHPFDVWNSDNIIIDKCTFKDNAYVETYLVESSSGPARKYYHITPEGLRYQEAGKKEWEQFVERTGRLL